MSTIAYHAPTLMIKCLSALILGSFGPNIGRARLYDAQSGGACHRIEHAARHTTAPQHNTKGDLTVPSKSAHAETENGIGAEHEAIEVPDVTIASLIEDHDEAVDLDALDAQALDFTEGRKLRYDSSVPARDRAMANRIVANRAKWPTTKQGSPYFEIRTWYDFPHDSGAVPAPLSAPFPPTEQASRGFNALCEALDAAGTITYRATKASPAKAAEGRTPARKAKYARITLT